MARLCRGLAQRATASESRCRRRASNSPRSRACAHG
jgi:hypothetical protein